MKIDRETSGMILLAVLMTIFTYIWLIHDVDPELMAPFLFIVFFVPMAIIISGD